MEELIQKLRAYSRFLELEGSIPYWEGKHSELAARIEELKRNRNQKELALSGLDNPTFFQNVFGGAKQKKQKLSGQLREVTAALTAAQWELEALDKKIQAGKQEQETLRNSRTVYEEARKALTRNPAQESRLMMEEISAFAPAAMEIAGRLMETLEDARFWMQKDSVRDTREMEFLSKAEADARQLYEILSVMPEGVATIGGYLQEPHAYICGVTSEQEQPDRLNLAIEQIGEVRTQLRLLLGE